MNLDDTESKELLLKQCWLARYWGLAARYGVYNEIANSKHNLWASLAPSPFECVMAAAEKAMQTPAGFTPRELRPASSKRPFRHLNSMTEIISAEADLQSTVAVEKALREMTSLRFKQAWLLYFWSRAKWMGLEKDLAEERVNYWMQRRLQSPTSPDTVDVENGLLELQKLGLDKQQLWEEAPLEDREKEHAVVAS
ncbi:hypothetical protein R1sor_000304 [Riccia sorocarpa]|uniref:Uncharacterized protein n=1 Tax=Riccia sorocarpa TaxID=122646 RepID=A0ABD3GVS6_9MARC